MTQIRHYKSGTKMLPIVFPSQQMTDEWDKLCSRIKVKHHSDPHPYFEDYFKFTQEYNGRSKTVSEDDTGRGT